MKINNKDLIQSYIVTTSRYNFSAYEKRVFYRIIEILQAELKGKKLNYKYSIQETILGDRDFTLPISCFLKDESDKNYHLVKKALIDLNSKTIEFEDDKTWELFNLIERPKIGKYESYVKLRLAPEIYTAFLNFSKGFRKYELGTAMQFESVYSMRFYELFSGKKEPIIYEIDELKKMFMIEDKYKKKPFNFIKKVIDVAQKELTSKSPYSFKFEPIKTGRSYTHIKFKPFYIPKNRDEELEKNELEKKVSVGWSFDSNQLREFKDRFDLSNDGINNNKELLLNAVNHIEYKDWVVDINGMIRKYDISNKSGFFVSQLKKRLEKNDEKN